MHMTRLRDERGGILVLSALMIPVFLLLCALVIDVGNWYTHKRQLQNRADAAAFAAGIEYAKNWKSCVYSGTDPTRLAQKATAIQEIADAARQYAGNPDPSDYAGGTLPSTPLRNTEIATQANVDVVINSTIYDNNTDYSDDYDGVAGTNLGNPCFKHTTGDDISAPGYWTDVRVKERDLPSLFGGFGLPLPRNGARARVDIRPAISGHRFLPLAIPDNIVTKVQVRYFDQCTGTELLKQDLAELPSGEYNDYRNSGGGTLWAVPNGDPDGDGDLDGDRFTSVSLPMTAFDRVDCGALPYRPIAEQVRIASAPDVDLNATCSDLQNANFADCFTRLSQIRIWDDGNPSADEPLLKDVRVLGGCPEPGDEYFGVLPLGQSDCAYDVSVDVDWGSRDNGDLDVPANFKVSANGTLLAPAGGSGDTKTYTSSGGALSAAAGPTDISVTLEWLDIDPGNNWGGDACIDPPGSATSPCKYGPAAQVAHRTFVGVDSLNTKTDPTATGAVESVHTSLDFIDTSGKLGPSFDNWHPSGAGGDPCVSPCAIYPTVGIRSALSAGKLTVLRTEASQGSQLVHCDPNVTGQVLLLFKYGCEPWFGANSFTDSNWWTAAKRCPDKTSWYSYSAPMPYTNSPGNPWRCVINDSGSSVGQAGDWMAVATDNCTQTNPGGTQCQTFNSPTDPDIHCGNYDGKPGHPDGWVQRGGDSADPRMVSLFVVPYQALKDIQGTGTEAGIPVLRFASFYVMNWRGNNSGDSDPCPDPNFGSAPVGLPSGPLGKGTILGVFDSAVDYEPGPVDANAVCREDDPTPCRVTLVR
jgi:Putative Flp pilus-assembly TadE/G-like